MTESTSPSLPTASGWNDESFMRLALSLAERGRGWVEPNPMVGCVLVVGDDVIGSGFHTRFGAPHAEREAIADAERRGNGSLLASATAYVTLEPCCHFGKTPPCTDALLSAHIKRVVVAMLDPFEQVSGRGVSQLQSNGIEVNVGTLASEALELNAPYLKRIHKRRPWVIAKWAMSLDGKTASHTSHSQWISNEASRAFAHQVRSQVDAIVVGVGTALADDPLLTARVAHQLPRTATRVVVDSQLRLSRTSQLVRTARDVPTLIWCGPQANEAEIDELRGHGCSVEQSSAPDRNQRLDELLLFLGGQLRATNVLIEGGGQLVGSLLDIGQIDETLVYVAPKLIGGERAVSPTGGIGFSRVDEGPRCSRQTLRHFGDDLLICSRWDWNSKSV